jgi:hypothetical protein
VAYRSRIFSRFRGFLTLGSPLAKFAAIWPARVPIANVPAFRLNTEWLNVYDPLDPVSGSLKEFRGRNSTCCPSPVPIGYCADWKLLLSHLRYLTCRPGTCLADGVAGWLINGRSDQILKNDRTLNTDRTRNRTKLWHRSLAAWAQWIIAGIVLSLVVAGACEWGARKLRVPFIAPDFFGSLLPYTIIIILLAIGTVVLLGTGAILTRFAHRLRVWSTTMLSKLTHRPQSEPAETE